MNKIWLFRLITMVTAAVYLVFYLLDRKIIEDERERLIDLKAIGLQQTLSIGGLAVVMTIYILNPSINAIWPIMIFSITSIYSYILGKIYYRKTM